MVYFLLTFVFFLFSKKVNKNKIKKPFLNEIFPIYQQATGLGVYLLN